MATKMKKPGQQPFKLNGPYEIDIIAHITNGEVAGEVTMSLSMGEPPTQSKIDECLERANGMVEEQGFRLMNKSEFFNAMMQKRLDVKGRFACPGTEEWDK
jgi:hypothetical protein